MNYDYDLYATYRRRPTGWEKYRAGRELDINSGHSGEVAAMRSVVGELDALVGISYRCSDDKD
jgi:ABC-type sulfate transport system substrate-binding protein